MASLILAHSAVILLYRIDRVYQAYTIVIPDTWYPLYQITTIHNQTLRQLGVFTGTDPSLLEVLATLKTGLSNTHSLLT